VLKHKGVVVVANNTVGVNGEIFFQDLLRRKQEHVNFLLLPEKFKRQFSLAAT
jgi:hypothetical protein